MAMELTSPDRVGWVSKLGVESEDYAWAVRCREHPPEQPLGWEEISSDEAMERHMLSDCEICGESLI